MQESLRIKNEAKPDVRSEAMFGFRVLSSRFARFDKFLRLLENFGWDRAFCSSTFSSCLVDEPREAFEHCRENEQNYNCN
jgi:hypothetical protein